MGELIISGRLCVVFSEGISGGCWCGSVCVGRGRGRRARSGEDAGMPGTIQGGNAETGTNPETGSAGDKRGGPWDLEEGKARELQRGKTGRSNRQ